MGQKAVSSASVKPITSVRIATFWARTSLRSSSAYALRFSVLVCGSPACEDCWCAARLLANRSTKAVVATRITVVLCRSRLRLHLGRVVLEDLGHRLVDALVA